ncbi:DUF4412 domain-containing protein [Algoriphagus halophytocola]|uniref:DUF4412 domain-containing protein n=1 Tax=Algoriphagus halophytocola TaxID=2991499 RepID=A0ABY6MKM6_9BACT|nr:MULTISPECIES: DUF4412 domain-containing protein [unclassified Algoriphagus]UZD23650.1 DUF4412 domain-containing protein [Algoriphagus sp. TR-M5]WBL44943.1 DUF4412 domain-containing protein [Algoriphagus sp. TR-M9]
MKTLRFIYILSALLLFTTLPSQAQFLKKIQKAANRGIERAIEDKVEEEASKMAQKQIEKIFTDMYGEDSIGSSGMDMSKIMKGLGEPVDTEEAYPFLGYVVLELNSTDEKGKKQDPVQLKSYLAENAEYTGMELNDPKNPDATTAMVFDTKNQASVLFLDNKGEKSSFAYKLDLDGVDEMTEEQIDSNLEDEDMVLEKTGNTKDILGYTCEEYHVKSKDGEGYYWVTEEPIGGYQAFWSSNSPMMTSKAQEKYAERFKDLPKGNFMEMTYTSTDGSKVDMKVIEIEENAPKTFTMAEYPNLMNSMGQN